MRLQGANSHFGAPGRTEKSQSRTKTVQNLSNKHDFSLSLKESTDEACLLCIGMSFHSLGAVIEKTQSPYAAVLHLGAKSRN